MKITRTNLFWGAVLGAVLYDNIRKLFTPSETQAPESPVNLPPQIPAQTASDPTSPPSEVPVVNLLSQSLVEPLVITPDYVEKTRSTMYP